MDDLSVWLSSVGFDQYAAAFAAQGIDFEMLPELSDGDLERCGVAMLGHRKKLLKAISSLASAPKVVPSFASVPQRLEEVSQSMEPERRQLTVMFCDLVGSTALSTQLDPEDLRMVVGAFHQTVVAAVAPFDGHVAQLLGDGVLVYFGFPRAHEGDADRAVRAALAARDQVWRMEPMPQLRLNTRIGIATGSVVVGPIGAGTAAAELSATGETPNLAARLQGRAAPGEIVVSDDTRRLLGHGFDLEPLEPLPLKGIERPIGAWRVQADRLLDSRFAAQRAPELLRFVGRGSELDMLLDRWQLARDGEGQVVRVIAEAGLGKSRLAQELRTRLDADGDACLTWQCSAYFSSSALHPLARQLELTARFESSDNPQSRGDKLRRMLEPCGIDSQAVAHLSVLLNLPAGDALPAHLSAQQAKVRTLQAAVEVLRGIARNTPLLVLLEDAHWIDPTTDELVGACIEQLRQERVLLLVTSRPEYQPAWGAPVNLTTLMLSRLGQRHCVAMINSVSAGRSLPNPLVDELVRRADGIPLFVEELTKAVLESGTLRETAVGFELSGSLPELAVPMTLQDSLMARLDRTARGKPSGPSRRGNRPRVQSPPAGRGAQGPERRRS